MWGICLEMAPYLLLGFLFSGIISVFIDDSFVYKQIGRKKFSSVLKSTLMGIPLPLCSCGVIPVAATLKDYGASKGATTSFLVSTPQTGLDSIFLTYGMLGPVFAIFRPAAAFISGLFCGLIVNIVDEEEHIHHSSNSKIKKNNSSFKERLKSGLKYGFLSLPEDIVVPLFQGLVIAASIGFFVPPDFIASYVSANALLEYFVMLLVSLPLYVCATASIPIALVLYSKGISAGAIFIFLMAGPATNASSIAIIGNIMGRKILYVYMVLIAFSAVFFGVLFDLFFEVNDNILNKHSHHHMHENLFYMILTVFFGFIMANAYYSKKRKNIPNIEISKKPEQSYADSLDLIVNGMTCNHCKESVESSIKSVHEDAETSIDLTSGKVLIRGLGLDEITIREKIEGRGFTVES